MSRPTGRRRWLVAWAVLAFAVPALVLGSDAAAAGQISLRGRTTQGEPIQLKLQFVGAGGRLSGTLRYVERCEVAGRLRGHLTSPFSGVTVSSSGRFHVGAGPAGTVSLGNGYTGDLELKTLTGRVDSRGMTFGRFDMAMTVESGEGTTVDHCNTRAVRFHAKLG
jgi:hypothetical protein